LFFTQFLSRKEFIGEMIVDPQAEKLELRVNPLKGAETFVKSTKALSGGEKSYSTICFIMALWEAIQSPFRALDEFDVFMDMVNRRIAVDALVTIARLQKNRQFILLSPLKIGDFDYLTAPDVKIHRLLAPERCQTILNFGGAAAAANDEDDEV